MVECFEACRLKVFHAGVCPCQKVTHLPLLVVCLNLLSCSSYLSSAVGEIRRAATQAFQVVVVEQQDSWESTIFVFLYSDE